MPVRLRPHHVLCSIGFEGSGYNDAFTANMGNIVYGQLRAIDGPDVTVRIANEADSICAPCPLRLGTGCASQALIDALDDRHGKALGLAAGDQLRWADCVQRVVARIEPDDLDTLCAGCDWLEQGMCKRALATLLDNKKGHPEAAPLP
ncbi:MAG: DUF1284 domain-containing protein [Jannaschia sp.]